MYYVANKEKISLNSARWAKENQDRVNANHAAWVQRNPEKRKTSRLAWDRANSDHKEAYRKEHLEEFRAYSKKYRETNPEKVKSSHDTHMEAHPEASVVASQKRRARLEAVENTLTKGEAKLAYRESGGLCTYCGEPVGNKRSLDHIFPISKGGSNTFENVTVVCVSCNSKKGNRSVLRLVSPLCILLVATSGGFN